MLRELKTRHNGPRMFYGQVTTSGGNAVTANIGSNDYSTVTESAAGAPVITLKQPFKRLPVVVGTAGTTVAAGGYVDLAAASTTAILSLGLKDAAGSGNDGVADFLAFGYVDSDTDRVLKQSVLCSKRRSRIFGAKLTGDGSSVTVNFGKTDVSASRTSQGVYAVTFKRAFSQTPIVLACGISSSAVRAPKITGKSATGCTVSLYDEAGAVQDDAFYLVVVGTDIRDEHGGAFASIDNPQRKPRIVVGQITVTAGTPAFTINSNEFSSVTDNGAGDFTLNLNDAFRQAPIIIATGRGGRVQVHTGSASVPRLICRNAAGTAADPTTVDFILLGTDDPSEY